MRMKYPIDKDVRIRLATARLAAGRLTQKQAAKLYRISPGHLGKVEAGSVPATPAMLALIAARLGIREEWLSSGNGPMEADPKPDQQTTEAGTYAMQEAAVNLISDDQEIQKLRQAAELTGCEFRNLVRLKLQAESSKKKGVSQP